MTQAFAWRRCCALLTLLLTLMSVAPARATTPPDWKSTAFAIDTGSMSLDKVLEQFGVAYGVRVVNSANGAARPRGRIKADNGADFLDRLGAQMQFRWFVYNATLYVLPRSDNVSVRLQVGEDAVLDAKAALLGMGLFESRFGWGELPDEGVVIIGGPRAYVDLARQLLTPKEKEDSAAKGRQMMVFRLKYASVLDRVITTRGQKETIPGIKTILSSLVGETEGQDAERGNENVDLASHKRSRQPKASQANARADGTADADGAVVPARDRRKASSGANRPRFDANGELNALIVYDDVSKREMYQALLAEFDVEPRQIEIEALIVDIDRTKLGNMGAEWGVSKGSTSATVNSGTSDSLGTALPLQGSSLLISNSNSFYARLKELEGSGDATVLGKPSVLTLNNVPAVLDLSQTAYVPLVGERVADLANVSVGTMLRVVPRLVQEGALTRVRLEVDIEDGRLGDTDATSKVTRSTISTQALVGMQQTLMIGGYHVAKESQQDQKTPFLGDAPLIGALFRSRSASQETRERLFLITPRLAGLDGAAAPAQSESRQQALRLAEAQRQALTPADVAAPDAPAAIATQVVQGSALRKVECRPARRTFNLFINEMIGGGQQSGPVRS